MQGPKHITSSAKRVIEIQRSEVQALTGEWRLHRKFLANIWVCADAKGTDDQPGAWSDPAEDLLR